MTDVAAVKRIRDSQSTVQGLPGVQRLIFTCMTVPECRQKFSPRPTAPPS
jgi:cell division transport system permease protein